MTPLFWICFPARLRGTCLDKKQSEYMTKDMIKGAAIPLVRIAKRCAKCYRECLIRYK